MLLAGELRRVVLRGHYFPKGQPRSAQEEIAMKWITEGLVFLLLMGCALAGYIMVGP